ncbi:putative Rho guanyl nucleotide exchange factor [Aspergillus homomorphus CBS 101889]|uniref:Dynamin-binding protein n=1 Tax=Aspergillus homomorphus (strain CBS 101889) TaxID=1450537 RepID=A0A395I963_ASPHC|nr:Rho guanyl nucleotide exchange factor [Aspergillus homomorphus CBS 101889]RAL15598.1 Rho guanyl nucleotide exchange factor [Aspergillus homomorphus CBS 101889]
MSGSDVEHASRLLDGSRRLSSSNTHDIHDPYYSSPSNNLDHVSLVAPSFSPVPSLSGITYPAQPSLTSLQPYSLPATLPVDDHKNTSGRSSPDPDDFYRPHLPTSAGVVNDGAVVEDDSDVTAEQRPQLFQRVSSVPIHSIESPGGSVGQGRSVSDSSFKGVGGNSAWGSSARVSTARARQTPFKDLINRFNNNSDQVLPVPSSLTSGSRAPSRAASPTSPAGGLPRSGTLPRSREARDTTNTQELPRWHSLDTFGEDASDLVPLPLRPNDLDGNLNHRNSETNSRRAVFGEKLIVDTGFLNAEYGASRRRGSEGNILSSSPAFLDQLENSTGLTPLTPTAWYLGRTPFLEEVSTGTSPNDHRRTRSDFVGNWSVGATAHPPDLHMAVPAPLQSGAQTFHEHSHTKSRIPISSHRLHSTSDSDESSSPSRADCTGSRSRSAARVPLPPKGTSRLPKPSPKAQRDTSHDDHKIFITPPRTHARSRRQIHERSGLLEAYIAAPPPAKSPPLRSSRPRQPVSHTTLQNPRSKVVETVSNIQRQINRDREPRSSRPRDRRLPELGHVDFATRREKIQQAFNRTVQENERKEEKAAEIRRRNKDLDDKQGIAAIEPEVSHAEQQDVVEHALMKDDLAGTDGSVDVSHEQSELELKVEETRTLPQLYVNTDVMTQAKQAGTFDAHTTMDSPTLGHQPALAGEMSIDCDAHGAPASAITSGSNETHVTAFDIEPQVDLTQDKQASHRAFLNQIMHLRESSSSSSSCDEQDCSVSETDDKESVPIMLRDALGYDDHTDSSENQEQCDLYTQNETTDNEMSNRWSISSWSSSLHNQHSTDEQCEGSGDELPQPRHSTDDSEIATQSCSASSSTPSVTGHPPSNALAHDSPYDPRVESVLQANPYAITSAPSLARLGGWDSKRVSQLYIQEIASGRGLDLPLPAIRASPEPQQLNARTREDGMSQDQILLPLNAETPASDRMRHTASLIMRDDWEHASPSIMDWMQVAADGSTPQSEQSDSASKLDNASTPRLDKSIVQAESQKEERERLGLAIDVQIPQESKSYEHSSSVGHVQTAIDNVHPPTQYASTATVANQRFSTYINGIFSPLDPINSTGSSENSSLQRLEPTLSPETLHSSATSLAPSSSEHIQSKPQSPSPEQRRLKKRRNVIKELVDTEYTFGRDMKVVDDIYKGTSSSCLDLSSEDVKVLFANSDQVVQFSMAFQDALKEAAKSVYVMPKSQRWSSKRSARHRQTSRNEDKPDNTGLSDHEKDQMTFIGQAFVAHIGYMEKVYADYLRNHDAANRKLQTLQRNPKVAIWLKECRDWASDLTTAWDLDSLIVKPVQRILKYPLLLSELLDSTPSDHPDRAALITAFEEVTNISVRINEMKKRADLVGQVVGRKRKESDVRTGLSKAFGRRTEKLKQQVGLTDLFEDKEYDSLSQKFGDNFFQLQLVMRDAESYTKEVQSSLDCFAEFVSAIEGFIDVSQSNYVELEGKWRELTASVQTIMTVTLPDHLAIVRKSVIDPMITLLKLHDGPQRVMKKRDKRLMDYVRFKSIKDRGDRPDKKTTEQGEQFIALNETLKDELPKLYALTAKLMEACLKNFVQIQTTWFHQLQRNLGPLFEAFPDDIQKIVENWSSKFNYAEGQVLSLGICNGSLLADTVNLVNFNTPSTGATISSPRRPSTVNSVSTRMGSTIEESPKASQDFSIGGYPFQSPSIDGQSQVSLGRRRADSTFSGRAHDSAELPRSQMLQQVTSGSSGSLVASNSNTESFPSLPRLSLDSPFLVDVIGPSQAETRAEEEQHATSSDQYSNFFSSAMPMSDNPQENTPLENEHPKEPAVLFLAASIYEFNIDRARREAGYPYLTYVVGEIFDVIAEKGELWLAKNQDDPERQVGWIWNKHFAKLTN